MGEESGGELGAEGRGDGGRWVGDLGEELAIEVEVDLSGGEIGVEAEGFFVGFGGFLEAEFGLEDMASEIVVGGVIGDLFDGVVDFGEGFWEALILNEIGGLIEESGGGAAEFGEASGGDAFAFEGGAFAGLGTIAGLAEVEDESDDEGVKEEKEDEEEGGFGAMTADEEGDLFGEASALGFGGEAALAGGEIFLEVFDGGVAIVGVEGEGFHGDGGEAIGDALAWAVGEGVGIGGWRGIFGGGRGLIIGGGVGELMGEDIFEDGLE